MCESYKVLEAICAALLQKLCFVFIIIILFKYMQEC